MKDVANLRWPAWAVLPCMAVCTLVAMAAEPLAVPVVAVQARPVPQGYVLEGVIQAVKQSTVAAQASGRIASFTAKAGDRVRAGEVLATIDDREAQVGVQHAQAQISQADAELRNAQTQRERTRELQSKGFVSKAALDSAELQYKSALAQRDQASASARQSGISLGYTRVSAPFDGWVLQTSAQAGDLAVPGMPLLVIYAAQPLRAVVQVPASRAPWVRQAVHSAVLVDGEGAQVIIPLNRLEVPASDPVSQTIEWRLDLPVKEAAALMPGQQVRVRFSGEAASSGTRLLVPAASIVKRGELSGVYVASDKGFALRAVRLGSDFADAGVEVVSGLRAGERVALDPLRAAQPQAVAASMK